MEAYGETLAIRFWVKYPSCTRIVQAYDDQNEYLHILCEYATIGLLISYFNKDKSTTFLNLRTNNANLDTIIKEKFLSIDIPLPSTSDLTTQNEISHFAQDIRQIEQKKQSLPILIIIEQRRIRLFGLADIVKETEKQLETIKTKYASNTVNLNLEPRQITYLFNVYYDELKLLEAHYDDTKILDNLKNGEFTAPSYSHEKIEQEIMTLATLCSPIDMKIEEQAFSTIAHDGCYNLINIARQHKCLIEIQESNTNYICKIPKASKHDHISNELSAAVIEIHQNDLADQRVDLVVICSTSISLRDDILKKAGQSVEQEYFEAAMTSPMEPFETNAGQLQCRKLLFLPWEMDRTNEEAFYQSIRNLVRKAVQHAIKAHYTSIVFPSISYGKFNVDKNIIANQMLVEAQKQLLAANVLLQIIFVILPEQSDVFEAFQAKLESLQNGEVETKDTEILYCSTTLEITILSSNREKQEECKKALNDHVQKSILVRKMLQQHVLKRWTQPAITDFYKYCLDRHVIPDIDILMGHVKLSGPKEATKECEIEYYREQTKQSEQARLLAIARNIIWAYKLNDTNTEKYSLKFNAHIEESFSSGVPSVSADIIM
ncbi:unnamed protein product [Rotaria sp. Silwood1]|nr:unnamed protein product [Rotaria sp. Silwood1]